MTRTDDEPSPRIGGDRAPRELELVDLVALPEGIAAPATDFLGVLSRRRSRVGGPVPAGAIGSLLWHSTLLRARGFDGRFGQWESRACPSAGGLHPLRLLVLPISGNSPAGVYADGIHAVGGVGRDPRASVVANAESVRSLTAATAGTTVQLFADPTRIASCYANHETLLWRDAGAMTGVICLVAEALGLTSVPLGRHGTSIVRTFGLGAPMAGFGAVHVGMP